MRILIINPILYTAETDAIPKVSSIKDTMIYTMCMGFVKNGHEPVLIAAADYRPEKEEEYPFEVIFMESAFKKICKPRCLPFLPELGKYIKSNEKRIDAILASEVFSLCTLTAVRRMKKRTIIWHELGKHNKMFRYLPSKIWYNIAARFFMRDVKVIPRSEYAKTFIKKYCRRVSETVIDHGVDIGRITAREQKECHFIVVSQLIPRKRIGRIFSAFAKFLGQNEETKEYILDIAGRGELEQELKEQAGRLGISRNIVFHGHLAHERLAPLIAQAKAMLVYTEKDNNMVSIAESIAAGTPVITTTVPFNAEYIQREHLGIAEDDWDEQALNRICEKNTEYVKNCLSYREKLSAQYVSRRFIEEFRKMF